MNASLIACIVLLVFFIAVGVTAIALVSCSGRASRAEDTDPYRLAHRRGDAPAVDLDLALARDTGVDVTPDGSHENRSDVDGQRWSAEVLWLHEMFPEAELLGLEPDAQGDIVAPPVVPGRGGEGGN